MPPNPSTLATIGGCMVGAGIWGLSKVHSLALSTGAKEVDQPWSKSVVGQAGVATVAGWFQVYSGGIAIDTVATRVQAGLSPSQALWGVTSAQSQVPTLVKRVAAQQAVSRLQARAVLVVRSNLCAGHFVTMLSRFPYLFANFTSYAQAERLVFSLDGGRRRLKSLGEEFFCMCAATVVSSGVVSAAECPKVLDQLKPRGEAATTARSTVFGVIKEHGVERLMQGFTACLAREFLFNTALLGSPAVAARIKAHIVDPHRLDDGSLKPNSSPAVKMLAGREVLCTSLLLGLPMGFLTNAPDQLKTVIQAGRFINMREAWAHQVAVHHGSKAAALRSLFGPAAWWRAGYIAHAVVTFNLARDVCERWIEAWAANS